VALTIPSLRRLEDFSDDSVRSALKQHEKWATMVLELEEKVAAVVKKLKERGLVSPYLRSFVVAHINPLRWNQGRTSTSRRCSENNARARSEVQRRED